MIRSLAVFLLFAAALPAQEAGLYLRYSQWSTDFSGEVDAGGWWDLTKDLALKSDRPRAYGFLYRGILHRFSAEVCDASVRETIVAGEGFTVDGVPVEPGTPVQTALQMRTLGAEYWYHLVSVPSFRTGLILGAEQYDLETRIQELRAAKEQVVPYVGLGLTALTPRQGIYLDVALTVGEGGNASHLSGRIETGMDLIAGLGVYAGLRKVKVEIEDGDARWDLNNSSYYFGAQIHF